VTVNVDDVTDELYGLPPDQFIEARNAWAKELTATEDRPSAETVRKLSKPSVAAWLANVLVRKHPEEIDQLLELGQNLRQAQKQGAGNEMRRLSGRRQALVHALVALGSEEARAAGHDFGAQVQGQLEGTLDAAVADQSAATELRGGRLTRALSHVGFGEVTTLERGPRKDGARQQRAASSSGALKKPPPPRSGKKANQGALAQAERALAEATAALKATETSIEMARHGHEAASERRRRAARDLRDAERDVVQFSTALQRARETRQRQQKKVKQAEQKRRHAAARS
jgi:hypothetical protein